MFIKIGAGGILLALALAISPVQAHAFSPGEFFQSQINSLTEIISALKTQAAALLSKDSSSVTFGDNLRKGVTHGDIKKIQELLATDATIYPDGMATGYFGPKTEQAIKRFQERFSLNVTGVLDEVTRAYLEELYAQWVEEDQTPLLLSSPTAVVGVEAALAVECEGGKFVANGTVCKKVRRSSTGSTGGTSTTTTSTSTALETIKKYETALQAFFVKYNYFPATSGPTISCMGVPGVDYCNYSDWEFTTPTDTYHRLDMLAPTYMSTLVPVDTGTITVNGNTYRGATYNCSAPYIGATPQCLNAQIIWPTKGSSCTYGKTIETDGTNAVCQLTVVGITPPKATPTATVKEYETALRAFYTANGYFPATSGPTISCLGVPGVDTCNYADWEFTTPTDPYHRLDMLAPTYMSVLKPAETGTIVVGSDTYRGATYNCSLYEVSPTPKCLKASIIWPLPDIGACTYGTTIQKDTVGADVLCERVITP